MTDTQSESTGSRKKLLIPLVALMLCAVSIVGAGYAYNSTVTNTYNSVVAEGTTINLYDGDNVVTEGIISLEFMTYTHVLNGRAIYPTENIGIDATDTSATLSYTPGEPLANYASGYYLETTYFDAGSETPAGFHPVAAAADIDTAAEVAALAVDTETKGVVALDTYTLKIGNATDNAVDVKFKADYYGAAPTLPAGVRDILVTFTGNGVSKEVVSVKANFTEDVIATLASGTASAVITVNTYVIVSDSYSAEPVSLSRVQAAVDFTFGTAIVPNP